MLRKVLVALDDVDHINQFEALAVKLIYDVNLLSNNKAICLFCRYAFGRDIPAQGYEQLCRQVVRYAAGLLLTIRVLGSFICGKNELEWIDALECLKPIPLNETLKKLELSYLALEEDYKEFFSKCWRKDDAIKALESCRFYARNGLRVLQQKSLITIYKNYDYDHLGMRDHLEEMGRNIVRRSHPDKPHKHSRLWKFDEIEDTLANDLGSTKATKYIQVHRKKFSLHIFIKGLRKMKELRFLSVPGNCSTALEFRIVGPDFPKALQYLHWDFYPFRSLPTTYQANNLVALEMANNMLGPILDLKLIIKQT
uniref:Disease resistance protein Roq1-like winged-helix domain-containing protein n=1 Tax=Lactuca sativa TaxID=4236 RepID=A0A9R1VP26_LACSA|nr:hypothetical protein LSAT_V11C400215480 [Lactuca sativa]